jgi:hypothetical protein
MDEMFGGQVATHLADVDVSRSATSGTVQKQPEAEIQLETLDHSASA